MVSIRQNGRTTHTLGFATLPSNLDCFHKLVLLLIEVMSHALEVEILCLESWVHMTLTST